MEETRDWQDISTAPKDGTPILVFGGHPDMNSDYRVGYGEPEVYALPSPIAVAWWEGEDWRHTSYDSGYYGRWEDPTHWQPLPTPPIRTP